MWFTSSQLARIIHRLRCEVPEMPVMARKTTETTAGVFVDTSRIDEGVWRRQRWQIGHHSRGLVNNPG
jgi:hypothetical protein